MPICEHDQYSFRNTIRAGCIRECWLFFQALGKGSSAEQVRRDLADGVILGHYAYSTRMALVSGRITAQTGLVGMRKERTVTP